MGLIKCEDCGQMISDKAKSCPNCGCPNPYIAKEENPCSFGSDFNLILYGSKWEKSNSIWLIWYLFRLFWCSPILYWQNQGGNS